MEDKYKIFNYGFNKILDLVEMVDSDIINNYKKYLNIVPENVIYAVAESDDFSTYSQKFSVDYMEFGDSVSFDYSNKQPYLRMEILINKLFGEDLAPKKLFSMTVRNTKIKQPDLQFHYELIDGKLKLIRTSDKECLKNIDISWEVYLAYEEMEPFLIYKKYFRGVEVTSKEVNITFDELTQFIDDEVIENEYDSNIEY